MKEGTKSPVVGAVPLPARLAASCSFICDQLLRKEGENMLLETTVVTLYHERVPCQARGAGLETIVLHNSRSGTLDIKYLFCPLGTTAHMTEGTKSLTVATV